MRKLFILLVAIGLSCLLQAQSSTEHLSTSVLFAVDDHHLDPAALAAIDRLVASTDRSDEHEFILQGHTDADGSLGYNEVLARDRARSVKQRLVELGVDPDRISWRAFGERRPVASNGTDADKQLNRRVEIIFERQVLSGLDELNSKIASPHVVTEIIDTRKENWVRGPNGVTLRLEANTLVDAYGRPFAGKAAVTLTEAVALNDMMAEGLSTHSDGRMLETGGMLRVDAIDEQGQPLALAEGANMLVSIPTSMQQPGMTLFTSSTGSDWSNTGNAPIDFSKWDMPKRPVCAWPRWEMEVYRADLSGKPRPVTEPVKPHEPIAPRRESYTSWVAWYQALSKNSIEARDELRFQEAMKLYDERVAKYEEKLEKYHADCKTWPERYANQKAAYSKWVSDTLAAYNEFHARARAKADSIYDQKVAMARTRCEANENAWHEAYEARLKEIGPLMDSLGVSNMAMLGTYVFSASQMGWINCDRFYDVPAAQKYELVVQDTDTAKKNVYLVYTGINSMMRLQRDADGTYRQEGVPRNEPATVVAYKVEHGKAYLCKQQVKPREKMELHFAPASVAEVRAAIQDLRKG